MIAFFVLVLLGIVALLVFKSGGELRVFNFGPSTS